MATVTFDHVFKKYGEVTAVSDLNLEIGDGEFMVLVGPSGCGKTTSLRMIAGLEEISDGQLLIGDKVVNDVAPKDRDIAMVFQSYALYPHMIGPRQPRVRPQAAQGGQGRHREAHQRRGRHPPAGEAARPQAEGALRRPAPARRARPRHRPRARRVPHGRAAVQPGRQAPRPDPRRDRAPPPAPRHHDGLRHPRPGRGHDHGPADRGHERWPPPAGRLPAGPVRPPEEPVRRRLHRQPVDELHRDAGRPGRPGPGRVHLPDPAAVQREHQGRRDAGHRGLPARAPRDGRDRQRRTAPSTAPRTSSSTWATRSSST